MSPCQTEALSNSYDVLRKGKRIGSHTICFKEENDKLYVSAETKMKVKFLFFTAYRYQYVSREVWSNGSLNSVSTRVNDNGDKIATTAVRSQGSIKAKLEDTSSHIPFDFFTTNHWNSAAIEQPQLFNTITGKLNDVVTTENNRNGDYIEYSVEGELNITTRYDFDGNWLGMDFLHTDGSKIEFRCVQCGNTPKVSQS